MLNSIVRRARKAVALSTVPRYRRAMVHGVGAGIEHTPFLTSKNWQTIFDVGANKGQFSLAARHHQPWATVYAFEPLPHPVSVYRRVFHGDDQTLLHPFALGADDGTHVIHLSAREDSSSLLPIGKGQTTAFPGTGEVGEAVIEVRHLDGLDLEPLGPTLLKIDVQGYESEVLEGAERTLAGVDDVYVEVSFRELYTGQKLAGEITEWLTERDFRPAGQYNPWHDADGTVFQADYHFTRE